LHLSLQKSGKAKLLFRHKKNHPSAGGWFLKPGFRGKINF
jgi:hypothetical protein